MHNKNIDFNQRKLPVLQYISGKKEGVRAKNLVFSFGITLNYSRQLLFHYFRTDLLNRPKRGLYKLSARGRDRLEYLKLRQDISKETGVDIGLNFRKDKHLHTPIHTIVLEYQEKTGIVIQPGTF